MHSRGEAAIAGVFEHPTRHAPETSTPELHAEVADGALADAGLDPGAVDGYCTAGSPGAVMSMVDYLGLEDLSYTDSTDVGGASYLFHVGHAAAAIAAGKCDVVLITMAGRPRSRSGRGGGRSARPEGPFERPYGTETTAMYALAARRHMHEFGTTSKQLAEIRVAASEHAQYNDHAMYPDPVTVEDVVDSRLIADPLHLLDCCVISDGGGAVVLTSTDTASDLDRATVPLLGHGEATKHHQAGAIDLTYTGAVESGPAAFAEAGVTHDDIEYASIYDSFTITVLETLEDLGFCEKGAGGEFVEGGTLRAPHGELPFNTDGGGLCNNHPANRGGMPKIIETVRQLRGEANDPVQVPDCETAIAHGTGGSLGSRMSSCTLVMGGAR